MASFEEVLREFLSACRYARKTSGACNGHRTVSLTSPKHVEQCVACGKEIAFDLVNDPAHGFRAGCSYGDD